MLATVGIIIGIIAGAIIIIGTIIAISKSGLKIFDKINKIDGIEKATNTLLFIHKDELFDLYGDQIKIVFNPNSELYPEKEYLLERLRSGYLMPEESQKLTEILKYEENEAKKKNLQIAVLVIGALLLLVALTSQK